MAAELPPLYHLVPAQQWKDVEAAGTAYFPATYEADGFTHMTEDASVLLTVGALPNSQPPSLSVLGKLTAVVHHDLGQRITSTPPSLASSSWCAASAVA